MENKVDDKMELVSRAFTQYHNAIVAYISRRIKETDEAEDMAQDVFVRLMSHIDMLRETTIKSFLYTIAQNIVIDYLRKNAKRLELQSYMYDATITETHSVEEQFSANDILALERKRMEELPSQRRKIYCMSRFEDLSSREIAEKLNISRRTVEFHLLLGRKDVREYIRRACC